MRRTSRSLFYDRWQFHADQGASLCILAMETEGRMHPEFLLWLKSYLRAYSGDGHHSFYWAYRNTVQRMHSPCGGPGVQHSADRREAISLAGVWLASDLARTVWK